MVFSHSLLSWLQLTSITVANWKYCIFLSIGRPLPQQTWRGPCHRAAMTMDAGLPATMECSIAKCLAGDVAVQHTANAVQIFGGSGYIRGLEVERLYRDAKIRGHQPDPTHDHRTRAAQGLAHTPCEPYSEKQFSGATFISSPLMADISWCDVMKTLFVRGAHRWRSHGPRFCNRGSACCRRCQCCRRIVCRKHSDHRRYPVVSGEYQLAS
jgi:hypothetical protein